MLLVCGGLVNGPYALITTAVSADLVTFSLLSVLSMVSDELRSTNNSSHLPPQGTHKSLKGNARALSTVTAIIDGTGSVGECRWIT